MKSEKDYFNQQRYKTPAVVFLMLIREENGKEQILLQKRKNTGYMDGKYDFGASGHIEEKESLMQALIRESKEEIGIDIDIKDIEFVTMIHDISYKDYFNIYFKVKKWKNTPKINEGEKIEEIKWYDIDNLPDNIIKSRLEGIKNYKEKIYYSEIY